MSSPLRRRAGSGWLATAAFALATALLASVAAAQSACNGRAEFCDRTYSNVSILGTHNSYGVSPGNLAANQNYSVTTQLDNGVRMLQVQGHMNGNELHLCHTSCFLLDAGTFTSYLAKVRSWLDANPDEVVTLLLVNSDAVAASVWAQSYTDSGLSKYVYTPSNVPIAYGAWPTYRELINAGSRVVSFLAQGADVQTAPFLIDEFTNVWETPYDSTTNTFPCDVNRVTGSPANKMYLMNHFLDVNTTILGETVPTPATQELLTTNAFSGTGSLGAQASTCLAEHGYYPTFTLVDFYDVGDGSVFKYVDSLNGVPYVQATIGNGSSSTSGSSSSSGGGAASAQSSSGSGSVSYTPLNGGGARHGAGVGLTAAAGSLLVLFLALLA